MDICLSAPEVYALVVRDDWQGKGIGASLMRRLLFIAGKQKLKALWGTILPQNTGMLNLARKLGFAIRRDAAENAYNVSMGLS